MDLTALQNIKSPNYGLRGNTPITHIVIHAMMGTMAGTQATFQNPSSQVSAHYGISREGLAVRYVDDEFSAWHVCRANPFCLGVEHEDIWSLPNCPKQLFGGCNGRLPWLTGPQQLASVDLVATLMVKYNIPIENVIGHNDPYLKQFGNTHQDPGPWFPWNNYRFLIKQALVKLQPDPIRLSPAIHDTTVASVQTFPLIEAEPVKRKAGRPRKATA